MSKELIELIERVKSWQNNNGAPFYRWANDAVELVPALFAALEAAEAENARIKMDVKSLEIANRESMNMLIERDDEIKRLKSETYCAYCGERFELDNGSAALVSEHIRACVKHPMRAVEADNARLREALEYYAAQDYNASGRGDDGVVARAALEAAEANIENLRYQMSLETARADAAEYLLAEGDAHNPADFGLVPVEQLREMTARAERAEAATRWIPVGERLPNRAKRVLLFTSANETYTGWLDWVSKSGEIYFTVYELPGKIIHINHATYWRELPARPEPHA